MKITLEEILDSSVYERKVVHRGYSATERQLGHIYNGWRILRRRKIPRWKRWLYDGAVWEFIGARKRVGLYALNQ